MKTLNLLALDLGASNGRGILGRFDGRRVHMQETHRFENNYTAVHSALYWNILSLYENCKRAFVNCKSMGATPDAFGIDAWGVDYGLLDGNDRLLSNPLSYRNAVDADMEAVWAILPRRQLFERTGLAQHNFNTLFQLYRRVREGTRRSRPQRRCCFCRIFLPAFLRVKNARNTRLPPQACSIAQ